MSDFGLLSNMRNHIGGNFKSLTLHAHGRCYTQGRNTVDTSSYFKTLYPFVFDFPPVPLGHTLIPFVELPADGGSTRTWITSLSMDGNTATIYLDQLSNNGALPALPYVYIYTTKLPQIGSEDYGLEILDENSIPVFNSNIDPIKILMAKNTDQIYGVNFNVFSGKRIAVLGMGNNFTWVPIPIRPETQVFLTGLYRDGNSIRIYTDRWLLPERIEHDYSGNIDWTKKTTLVVIDVTDIKKND